MESNKVKLPREVAEAIDYAREKLNWSHANILVRTVRKDWESVEMLPIAEFCTSDTARFVIAQALVNGYEVEQTPEDRVRDMFNNITPEGWKFTGDANDPVYIERNAIRTTCILLGITIKGVNDHE